jgi:hypothetical protein
MRQILQKWIKILTSGFSGKLSAADNTIQKALDTLDDHTHISSEVGLGNVTNDGQLKREAGDFNTFTQKTTAVAGDILLIEDSTSSNSKKKLLMSGIDHTTIANKGTNTHAQIDTHIGSISNPHATTKSQVGLANVTNDAQLKRGSGDINSFTLKTPVTADVILIEDSQASYAKKKSTFSVVSHTILSGVGTNTHATIDTHLASTSNPHSTTASQVGLGNVPNLDCSNADNISSGTTNGIPIHIR